LENVLVEYSEILPTSHDTAIHELTCKSGPNIELVASLTGAASSAWMRHERDIEPLLAVLAAQFTARGSEVRGERAAALASVQAVRTALGREVEDLSSLHYADSILRLVGPVHPLGQQALRDTALTLRAHSFFSATNACLLKLDAVVRGLPQGPDRDLALGQLFSHRVGLALSIGRARATYGRPKALASLPDLLSGTITAARQIVRGNPHGHSADLVATLQRRAAELAFTWPQAPGALSILDRVYEWANEIPNETSRLGRLQWCRTALTVALQRRDEESFTIWDARAKMLSQGAPWHFTVLHEIEKIRILSQKVGLTSNTVTQHTNLITATSSDLARLSRYTARPEHSGSGIFLPG
jgi:hypothetical protein